MLRVAVVLRHAMLMCMYFCVAPVWRSVCGMRCLRVHVFVCCGRLNLLHGLFDNSGFAVIVPSIFVVQVRAHNNCARSFWVLLFLPAWRVWWPC